MSIHFEVVDQAENTYIEYNLVFTDVKGKASIIDQFLCTREFHHQQEENGKLDEMIDAIENTMTPAQAFTSYVEAFVD